MGAWEEIHPRHRECAILYRWENRGASLYLRLSLALPSFWIALPTFYISLALPENHNNIRAIRMELGSQLVGAPSIKT